MSYQSLEDRLAKRTLNRYSTSTAPPDLPVLPADDEPQLALVTRRAERASAAEVAANPRAASVLLRAAVRIREVSVSTFLTTARARALRPMVTLPRPRLTIVPRAASRAPRLPFVVFVVMLLALGLVGLLVLNTSMERGTYTDGALRSAG